MNDIFVDQLTGLLNREEFQARAEKRIKSGEFGLAITWFNVDNFKIFNRRFGFTKGSTLLREIAAIMQVMFPPEKTNIIARFSDDNFVVLSQWFALEDSVEAVQNSLYRLHRNITLKLRAGIYFPSMADDIETACDRAKFACDSIRKNHSVSSCLYREDMTSILAFRQYILDNFDEAIKQSRIKILYQPIIRVMTGKICETEALARWNDPETGFIPPSEFIPTLEQYKEIHKLDIFILNTICRDFKMRVKNNLPVLPVSVNLSRLDFELCDIFFETEQALEKNGISRNMIKIEITESVYGEDMTILNLGMEKFRAAGYEVWMDDFGSGYSSLNVLKDYNFDTIKFDMKFLSGFNEKSDKARYILSSNLSMAKQMGVQSLAEGVETPGQFEYLKSIGFEKAQGYLFGKPMELDEIFNSNCGVEDYRDSDYYEKLSRLEIPAQALMQRWGYTVADVRAITLLEMDNAGFTHIIANNEAHRQWISTLNEDQKHKLDETLPLSNMSKVLYFFNNGRCICSRVTPAAENFRTGSRAWLIINNDITRFPEHDQNLNGKIYDLLHEIFGDKIINLD